ncbi:MAG: RluA family pseudouridine synthase [Traorella sp.]
MEILYSNNDLIICIKQVGFDSEVEMVTALKELFEGNIYTVHRLDKNVGGVMVYARNCKTAAWLCKSIQEGKMIKEYVALVHGNPPLSGIWEDFLYKDAKNNKVYIVKKQRKGVKKAKLEYHVLSNSQDTSLVHIHLYTGRSHQIRVQFASRAYPLVGDHKYGSKDKNKAPLLYSCKITFPYQEKILSFESYPNWAK